VWLLQLFSRLHNIRQDFLQFPDVVRRNLGGRSSGLLLSGGGWGLVSGRA
jgi:hypothetical protein